MKSSLFLLVVLLGAYLKGYCQADEKAGEWPTWFVSTGKKYTIPPAGGNKQELGEVLKRQSLLDSSALAQVKYWNAGSPGYRWVNWMNDLWMSPAAGDIGPVAFMVLQVAIYDATVITWKEKYRHKRLRPVASDPGVKQFGPVPGSPSYPCETSVAAGVAVAIMKKYFPSLADSAMRMAERAMQSRVDAGLAYPSDTRAGFVLGSLIAADELDYVKEFPPAVKWNGKRPEGKHIWQGQPSFPTAGFSKTVVLKTAHQLRPGPPPDFARDMEELKAFQPGFQSTANAFYFATEPVWTDILKLKLFEHNIHLNPPLAAKIYAATAIGMYDGFVSCWDAKYTYWGTRPDQYDSSFKPVLFFSPPFPGYPSGHAMIGSVMAEIMAYFFPADKDYFRQRAIDGAESRFQGGIHFRTDNEVGLEMGRQLGVEVVQKLSNQH